MPTTAERWLPIAGYEGYYEVSDRGRVRSLDRTVIKKGITPIAGVILRPSLSRNGYRRVILQRDAARSYRPVHRIVAETFLIRIDGLNHVNHLNRVKDDNRAVNLEWCDPKGNAKHLWLAGGYRDAGAHLRKITQNTVDQIRMRLASGERSSAIAKDVGISYGTVRDIDAERTWRTNPLHETMDLSVTLLNCEPSE